jgi:hypothetical protein
MEERSVVTSAAESGAKIEERIGSLSEVGELRRGTRRSFSTVLVSNFRCEQNLEIHRGCRFSLTSPKAV